MKTFFDNNFPEFELEVATGIGLRKCQIGATYAVQSHFTKSNEPALISMPTGSGKTALMMCLSFRMKAKKILIITPSKVIRDQIADEFASLQVLKDIGCLKNKFLNGPQVTSNDKECNSLKVWEKLINENDVVVATPKTTSPTEKNIVTPPNTSFDLVFFDEAHHSPAESWNALVSAFPNSKIIFLTATPFRRDKKRIKASIVYHYSINLAIIEGIYRPVTYVPVDTSANASKRDELLVMEVKKRYRLEIKINPSAKLLIKTERIDHSEELKKIYTDSGFKVETIHNKKTDFQNKQAIRDCKSGVIEGLICVGMIGEGLDIPDLKIAVLHAVPKTLPFTIQFIGRISRINKNQTGNSYLITDPQFVSGEVRNLYKYDKGWSDLIPLLVDRKISHSTFLKDKDQLQLNPLDLEIDDFEPFFSVRIYKIDRGFKYRDSFFNKLSSDLEIVLTEQKQENDPLVIITKTNKTPDWGKNTLIHYENFDLHIFFVINNFLFEYTTSDFICNKLKRQLLDPTKYHKSKYHSLNGALKDAKGDKYFMLGLSNISGVNKSNPKYKMYLGNEVQASLRNEDGRVFAFGHALTKVSSSETRGVASNNSRIWAIKRDNIKAFEIWCKSIAVLIKKNDANESFPQLDMLSKTQQISKLPAEPIAIIFDNTIFNSSIAKWEIDTTTFENPNPVFTNISYDKLSDIVSVVLKVDSTSSDVNLTFNPGRSVAWQKTSAKPVTIHLDFGDNEPFNGSLERFVKEYPPLLILANGSTVQNDVCFIPKIRTTKFNQELYIIKDWSNTDVHSESKPAVPPFKFNVQEKSIEHILPSLKADDFLIIDDRANEIADIITIQPNDFKIVLYNCKFKSSSGIKPGANLMDIKELIEQGIRNANWIYYQSLIQRLIKRISEGSILKKGKLSELKKLGEKFHPQEWSYKIILVQPGISKKRIFSGKESGNIETLLNTLYDRSKAINADLEVWGDV